MGYRRTFNVRLIRRDMCYSVKEAMTCLGVTEVTVRKWLKTGLPVIDGGRPLLIHGTALIAFLTERQKARKTKLKPHEFYCLKCRSARDALDNKVDIHPRNDTTIKFKALCAACETPVSKVVSLKNLTEYQKFFDTGALAFPHISDTPQPSVKYHFKGEMKDEQRDTQH